MSIEGMKYDYKKAYDKNLKPSARLHYLENARHDEDSMAKMVGHGSMAKAGHENGSMAKAYGAMAKMDKTMAMRKDISPIMSHCSMARFEGQAKRDLKDMPLTKDMTGGRDSMAKNRGETYAEFKKRTGKKTMKEYMKENPQGSVAKMDHK
jgi:hypothetical protein